VSSDDVVTPFTYTLYDSVGNVVIKESDMTATTFTIGSGDTNGGYVAYQDGTRVDGIYGNVGLTNQVYNLVITDDNGKTVSKRVELSMPNMSLNYATYKLGTKFYNTTSTKKTYICSSDTDLYGRIVIDEVYIDGIKCVIKNNASSSATTWINPGENECVVSGLTVYDDGNQEDILKDVKISIKLTSLEGTTDECLCDEKAGLDGKVPHRSYDNDSCDRVSLKDVKINEGTQEETTITTLQFDVYQPTKYLITLHMLCNDEELEDNVYSEIIRVHNGENFNTFLNGMPVKFMLGTTNDNPDM
jgi:hypothetical protein